MQISTIAKCNELVTLRRMKIQYENECKKEKSNSDMESNTE